MIRGRNGETGFFGAIASLMIITVVCSSFFLNISYFNDQPDLNDDLIRWVVEQPILIVDGNIHFMDWQSISDELASMEGLCGFAIGISAIMPDSILNTEHVMLDNSEGEPFSMSAHRLFETEEGERIVVAYEVWLWFG